MATVYSSLYAANPVRAFASGADSTSTSYTYKGPICEKQGSTVVMKGTYNLASGTLGATNTILDFGEVAAGSRLIKAFIGAGDDDVDSDSNFTYDLGFTSDPDCFMEDKDSLQGTTELDWNIDDLQELTTAAVAGDHFLLTRTAGDLNSTGTIAFEFHFLVP